ncbi:MAG: hypothetical protein H8E18_02435 [FCB group bacterium]|nr:hypothetical protein [FCB group bacterium]
MSFTTEHKQKFEDLLFQIKNQDRLQLHANGGNSILFSYPPEEESKYLEHAAEVFKDTAQFIDISKLLVDFIEKDGWDSFQSYYESMKPTPHKVFKSDDPDPDLFDMIIDTISQVEQDDRIPVLIRTGALQGTGIDNIHIMEHPEVMNSSRPLVVFYPSQIKDDTLLFLNFEPASKYRCVVVK